MPLLSFLVGQLELDAVFFVQIWVAFKAVSFYWMFLLFLFLMLEWELLCISAKRVFIMQNLISSTVRWEFLWCQRNCDNYCNVIQYTMLATNVYWISVTSLMVKKSKLNTIGDQQPPTSIVLIISHSVASCRYIIGQSFNFYESLWPTGVSERKFKNFLFCPDIFCPARYLYILSPFIHLTHLDGRSSIRS